MTRHSAVSLAKVFGYMTEDEVLLLKRTVKMVVGEKPVLVNVGAGAGTSALAMREAKPDAELYSVDFSPGGPLGGLEGERNAFDGARAEYPHQILGSSQDVGFDWFNNNRPYADLIFIDDGHLESEIRGDIEAWSRVLIPEGYMVFHDYGSPRWPDVQRVVDERMRQLGYRMIALVDTLAVFQEMS